MVFVIIDDDVECYVLFWKVIDLVVDLGDVVLVWFVIVGLVCWFDIDVKNFYEDVVLCCVVSVKDLKYFVMFY